MRAIAATSAATCLVTWQMMQLWIISRFPVGLASVVVEGRAAKGVRRIRAAVAEENGRPSQKPERLQRHERFRLYRAGQAVAGVCRRGAARYSS